MPTKPQSVLCQLKPFCLGRALTCFLIVLFLNALVNIFNRIISEYWLCGDFSRRPVNCATLLFLVLYYLVTCQPRCFLNFTVGLIQAELLLQCFSFVWITQLMSMQLESVMPFLCDTFIGSMRVFKLLFILSILAALYYLIAYYKDGDLSCWKYRGGDDSDPCDLGDYDDDDDVDEDYEDMCDDYGSSFVTRSSQTCAPRRSTTGPPPPPPNWSYGPPPRRPSESSPYSAGPWGCAGNGRKLRR